MSAASYRHYRIGIIVSGLSYRDFRISRATNPNPDKGTVLPQPDRSFPGDMLMQNASKVRVKQYPLSIAWTRTGPPKSPALGNERV
jgi:hypothetical protein